MSSDPSETAASKTAYSASELLGWGGEGGVNWTRLRSLQFAHLSATSFTRLIAHAMGALIVLGLYVNSAPAILIFGWLLGLFGVLGYHARIDREFADAERRAVTRKEFRRYLASALLVALAWSVPLLVLPPYGSPADQLALWAVLAMLITGTALTLSSAPQGSLIFTLVTGSAGAAGFAFNGLYPIIPIVAVFMTFALIGTMRGARTFLSACIAEAGVAEKSEVVSLLLREFEESEADWLWEVDTNRMVRGVSPRFAFALGMDPSQVEGKPFLQLVSGATWETGQFPPSLHELAERFKQRESFSNLIVKVTIGHKERWWELSGTPRMDESGKFSGFRGVGSDVTEARESSDKIAWLARYDTLTGLPNRLMLMETLGDAMRYADKWRTRCAFLMIDLDRFKAVNDSLGHQVGDKLLAKVSERLKSIMSDNELCGRLGGDEFAIVIRDASDRDRVDQVARSVIEQLSAPYDIDHHTLYVGSSVGSAIGPRDAATVEELMRNADLALYRAKDEGGGTHCVFEPALHSDAEERRKLEFSIRRALEHNEFRLDYQPVVDARTEDIVSFEALLRWHSREHGFVSPAKFIPLAEDTRLIVPIGAWVLHEACHEAMRWPAAIRVAVNVSGEQLLDPHFSTTVISALSRSGLEPHRLEIEVTESIFVRDDVTARATLEKIMALGCSVALDDFGTGYSSLGYLRKLKFSTIKVDRSFVQGAAQNSAESLAIIRAVVAMADSLNMSTTAEGVETAFEADMIREMGCKKIQGYHFGRPMPAEDARRLFVQNDYLRTA